MSTFYVVYHSSASFTGAGAAHEQMLDQYAAACDAAELRLLGPPARVTSRAGARPALLASNQ